MAHTKSARKRVRQNEARAARNRPFRTRAAHALRSARTAIRTGDPEAGELVRVAQSALDRAAKRNIIHANAAARRKSRLVKALKQSQAA